VNASLDGLAFQFKSFHLFSDKLNSLLASIAYVIKFYTYQEIMIALAKTMQSIFLAEYVHFWLISEDIGVYYSYCKDGKRMEIRNDSGLLSQIVHTEGLKYDKKDAIRMNSMNTSIFKGVYHFDSIPPK